MYLYLCPQCESGNHGQCWRVKPARPPGSYGGSKCRCGCDGDPSYGKPLSLEDSEKLREEIGLPPNPVVSDRSG